MAKNDEEVVKINSIEEENEKDEAKSFEDMNVHEAKKAIRRTDSRSQIKEWLDIETGGKQRVTVLEPLQKKLQELANPAVEEEKEDEVESANIKDPEEVIAKSKKVYITPLRDMNNLYFGGTWYNFKKGQKQKVPRSLRDWLEEKKPMLIK